MNYIISEELRDRILSVAGSMLWSDMLQELRNLTPVQSGEMVTSVTGESIVKAWLDEDVRKRPGYKGWYSLMSNEDEDDLVRRIDRSIPAPTPQPEARGVDFMALFHDPNCAMLKNPAILPCNCRSKKPVLAGENEWDEISKEDMWNEIQAIRKLVDNDGTESPRQSVARLVDDLAHLQQAPQGVGEAIDDGEPCGYCARPRREHAPETYCPSSLFRELPQYTPKSILDASRLPAPVKVDDHE